MNWPHPAAPNEEEHRKMRMLLMLCAGVVVYGVEQDCQRSCPDAGNISDCCCSFADLESTNSEIVFPVLKRVVSSPFFAHFKIDLCTECELWRDAPTCRLRDCSVCECPEPPRWAASADAAGHAPGCLESVAHERFGTVDATISKGWMNEDHVDATVVDLRLNPERYTGYGGESAERMWDAIHGDLCSFPPGTCDIPEHRIYNRLLRGLHSSISMHIAHDYCLELDPDSVGECAKWGRNRALARERVLDHPDRVEDLFFAFAVVLRAVVKSGASISAAVPVEDLAFAPGLREWKETLFPEIQRFATACPVTFDEETLFRGEDARELRASMSERFAQLQRAMQCVGCDRCRLWGTLQTLGIGTALRVLFSDSGATPVLTRTEAVALANTLERLSSSLSFIKHFRRES